MKILFLIFGMFLKFWWPVPFFCRKSSLKSWSLLFLTWTLFHTKSWSVSVFSSNLTSKFSTVLKEHFLCKLWKYTCIIIIIFLYSLSSASCTVLCFKTLHRILQFHPLFKDVFREVGMLEVIVTCLRRYAALFEPNEGKLIMVEPIYIYCKHT